MERILMFIADSFDILSPHLIIFAQQLIIVPCLIDL